MNNRNVCISILLPCKLLCHLYICKYIIEVCYHFYSIDLIDRIFSCNNFSSLRTSAVNLRMPSLNLSVAIWSSFKSHLNSASFKLIFWRSHFFADSTLKTLCTDSLLFSNSSNKLGLMVSKSQPTSSLISPNY